MDDTGLQRRLGTALTVHRKAAGLTQEQLAEAVAVSTEWISQMERGLGTPSLDLLVRVAAAVGLEPTDLLSAALDDRLGRAPLQALISVARDLPDPAVETLVSLSRALAERWPKP